MEPTPEKKLTHDDSSSFIQATISQIEQEGSPPQKHSLRINNDKLSTGLLAGSQKRSHRLMNAKLDLVSESKPYLPVPELKPNLLQIP